MHRWSGKKVIIIGAARQGLALARYLFSQGARVVITDQRPESELSDAHKALASLNADAHRSVEWVCGGHPLSLLEGADLVCPSAGVPLTIPLVEAARSKGIPLSNDSQIFLEESPCPVIGITGSAGKTTTTTLVGRIATVALEGQDLPVVPLTNQPAYRPYLPEARVFVGGNIGTPLISFLPEMRPGDLAVMEISSFQLELMSRAPQVAAVLNITPNHLDRHETMAAYTAAKCRLIAFQQPEDVAVLNRTDLGSWGLASQVPGQLITFGRSAPPPGQKGIFLHDGEIYLRAAEADVHLLSRRDILLRGDHNLDNVLAACAIAAAAGFPPQAMLAGIAGFRGIAHRLEFVRSWGEADWYNDSIATAPERAMAAIHSFSGPGDGDRPLVLLAGGRDKDLSWEEFAALAHSRVAHLILFGEAAGKIAQAVESSTAATTNRLLLYHCTGLQAAVQVASQVITPGAVVLLSPGGTSFDEFRDFEHRGEAFRKWVMELQ